LCSPRRRDPNVIILLGGSGSNPILKHYRKFNNKKRYRHCRFKVPGIGVSGCLKYKQEDFIKNSVF
jgi:hypothetical protein